MVAFNDIVVKVKKETASTGLFEISPLPRGYGHTLANSLRRVLLSSLKGAAITAIRIEGVEHEYSTLDGVKEDVVEILLNLKRIKFSVPTDGAFECKINVSGEKVITASDIVTTNGAEVSTKDIEVATLTGKKSTFVATLIVESGVGYKTANENDRSEKGMIPLDADFTPVTFVKFEVNDARKGQQTNLDSVIIEINTDGSIAPKQALIDSAKIVQEFAGKVMTALGIAKEEVEKLAEESTVLTPESQDSVSVVDEVSSWKIEDLPISKRSKSGLLAGGYNTVSDMKEATVAKLLELPGFGNKSLNEVVELMNQYGIEIKSE